MGHILVHEHHVGPRTCSFNSKIAVQEHDVVMVPWILRCVPHIELLEQDVQWGANWVVRVKGAGLSIHFVPASLHHAKSHCDCVSEDPDGWILMDGWNKCNKR